MRLTFGWPRTIAVWLRSLLPKENRALSVRVLRHAAAHPHHWAHSCCMQGTGTCTFYGVACMHHVLKPFTPYALTMAAVKGARAVHRAWPCRTC